MARLSKILEPGEVVAVEIPGRENQPFWVGMAALIFVVETVVAIALHEFFSVDTVVTGAVLWGTLALAIYAATRWRLVVTDRRLLRRHGFFLSRLQEIRLDEIEEAHTEMGSFTMRLIVRSAGRETAISTFGIDLAPIGRILDRVKGEP